MPPGKKGRELLPPGEGVSAVGAYGASLLGWRTSVIMEALL